MHMYMFNMSIHAHVHVYPPFHVHTCTYSCVFLMMPTCTFVYIVCTLNANAYSVNACLIYIIASQ